MITKQIIDFNKSSFDKTFTTISILQEQTEKIINLFLDRANFLPEEGKKVISEWIGICKSGTDNLKTAADNNFKFAEKFLTGTANTLGGSLYDLVEKTDQSLKDATYKIKKTTVEVVDKSVNTIAAVADKAINRNTIKEEAKVTSNSSEDSVNKVNIAGKKPAKK